MLRLDHLVTQTRTVGDKDLQLLFALLLILVKQLLIRIKTSLTLGLTSLGSHGSPFKLALQCLSALAGLLLFLRHTLRFLIQPRRIVTLPGDTLATVKLQNPSGHMIQEVTVVRNTDHRTRILLQMLLQPVDRLCIQVVGRLIQQQYIRLLKQQTAQSHAAALTTGQRIHHLIFGRTTQGIHSTLQAAVQVPCIRSINLILQFGLSVNQRIHLVGIVQHFGITKLLVHLLVLLQYIHDILHPFLYDFLYSLAAFQLWILFKITHRVAWRENHFALIFFFETGNNLHQGRFSRPVKTDNTDLGTVEKGEINIL